MMIKTVAFVLIMWNGPFLRDGHFTDSVRYLSSHPTYKECVEEADKAPLTMAARFAKDENVSFILSCVEATNVVVKGTRPDLSDLWKSK
jgi:hypothetical protein